MDSIEFIFILAVLAVIAGWYIQNERAASPALKGLLALTPEEDTVREDGSKVTYKKRPLSPRQQKSQRRVVQPAEQKPAASPTASVDTQAKRRARYRRQDDARYRVKDKVRIKDKVRAAHGK